jgi:lactoylglutathione lyase
MELKLLVIRTSEPEKLAQFYGILGLDFEYHKHGNSPFHYSTTLGQTVLEIYPLTKSQTNADKNLRLGFELDNWDETLSDLERKHNVKLLIEPTKTEFEYMTIIEDPDGRKIELYKKALKVFKINILRFIDDSQPGWVECDFKDAYGKEHIIREKTAIISLENLDRNSDYPKEGLVACEVVKESKGNNGRIIYTVRCILWGVESIEGLTEFDLFGEQLTELIR